MLLGGTHGSTDISRSTVYKKCKTEPSGSAVSKKKKKEGRGRLQRTTSSWSTQCVRDRMERSRTCQHRFKFCMAACKSDGRSGSFKV